jgi:sugar/nucleoside kinase (ribokinase family)
VTEMRAIAMGVHVLDVLVRPVESIPEGQGGQLVEQIKITAAGSAGGAALTLAKLGAEVRSAGAIGTDAVGEMLVALLERDGVDTSLLVWRDGTQTSASVLPIRPSGERPAFHVVGANQGYGPDDVDWGAVAKATHLHLGGPEFMGGESAARILSRAREHEVVTSADILAPGDPGLLSWIEPALPHLDYLLPNDEQVLGFTGFDRSRPGLPCADRPRRRLRCRDLRGGRSQNRRRRGQHAGSGRHGRRCRHHRLRRRVLGRVPAGALAWS